MFFARRRRIPAVLLPETTARQAEKVAAALVATVREGSGKSEDEERFTISVSRNGRRHASQLSTSPPR